MKIGIGLNPLPLNIKNPWITLLSEAQLEYFLPQRRIWFADEFFFPCSRTASWSHYRIFFLRFTICLIDMMLFLHFSINLSFNFYLGSCSPKAHSVHSRPAFFLRHQGRRKIRRFSGSNLAKSGNLRSPPKKTEATPPIRDSSQFGATETGGFVRTWWIRCTIEATLPFVPSLGSLLDTTQTVTVVLTERPAIYAHRIYILRRS